MRAGEAIRAAMETERAYYGYTVVAGTDHKGGEVIINHLSLGNFLTSAEVARLSSWSRRAGIGSLQNSHSRVTRKRIFDRSCGNGDDTDMRQ